MSHLDLSITYHGDITLVNPQTPEAGAWLVETTPTDAKFLGHSLVVEPKYLQGFMLFARDAGFKIGRIL